MECHFILHYFLSLHQLPTIFWNFLYDLILLVLCIHFLELCFLLRSLVRQGPTACRALGILCVFCNRSIGSSTFFGSISPKLFSCVFLFISLLCMFFFIFPNTSSCICIICILHIISPYSQLYFSFLYFLICHFFANSKESDRVFLGTFSFISKWQYIND